MGQFRPLSLLSGAPIWKGTLQSSLPEIACPQAIPVQGAATPARSPK
jgi:hypothetical protein